MPTRREFSMPIGTRRILLINDDNNTQEMMQLCLETILNCEVIVVDSGMDGLKKASREKIDAILLDLDETMPDLSWSEIINNLKQNPRTNCITMILLTSTPQSQELIQFQQIGDTKAISKSFDLFNLASQVSILLNWN
jgi:response regulator RpfG family c-di-GMP phosphodiesterase